MLNTKRPVTLRLAENQADGKPTTFYACRKVTNEGPIPRGTPLIFEERVPAGWELMGADDPWFQGEAK